MEGRADLDIALLVSHLSGFSALAAQQNNMHPGFRRRMPPIKTSRAETALCLRRVAVA
jgi:hypothetical protein